MRSHRLEIYDALGKVSRRQVYRVAGVRTRTRNAGGLDRLGYLPATRQRRGVAVRAAEPHRPDEAAHLIGGRTIRVYVAAPVHRISRDEGRTIKARIALAGDVWVVGVAC